MFCGRKITQIKESVKYDKQGGQVEDRWIGLTTEQARWIGLSLNHSESNGRNTDRKFNKLDFYIKICKILLIICALTLTVHLIFNFMVTTPSITTLHNVEDINYEENTTNYETSTLVSIVINKANFINKKGSGGFKYTYVKVYDDGNFIAETPVVENSPTPVWNYQIPLQIIIRPDTILYFYVHYKIYENELMNLSELNVMDMLSKGLNGQRIKLEFWHGQLYVTLNWEDVTKDIKTK